MEIYKLEQDLKLFCVAAKSFPHDIAQAFDTLVKKIGGYEERTFFGISYQTDAGAIIYKAAVLELYEGEGEKLDCEPFTLQKGDYLAETIRDWRKDVSSIGITFRKMVDTRNDTTFPCVEWYKELDVMCMIRIGKKENEAEVSFCETEDNK